MTVYSYENYLLYLQFAYPQLSVSNNRSLESGIALLINQYSYLLNYKLC